MMSIARISTLIVMALALAALGMLATRPRKPATLQVAPAAPQTVARSATIRRPALPALSSPADAPDETDAPEVELYPPAVDYDWRQVLRENKPPPRLPREVVEAYLQTRQRDMTSLLAAFHALGDTDLLAEAAARFPNDPRVQWTVLSHDLFPEERRKWLDLFKTSAPDNALANYLSAQNLMQNNYDEASGKWLFGTDKLPLQEFLKTSAAQTAINELAAATGKSLFKNFMIEARLDEEELNLAAGRSPIQARLGAYGWGADQMSELARFKSTAICLQELTKSYLAAGDTASAQDLTRMGLALADRLRTGESGKLLIDQLVGMASEALLINAWDGNTSCEFLGGKTPKERQAELKTERAGLRALSAAVEGQESALNESDMLSYLDRQRIYGELEAWRWLQQRTQAGTAPAP